MVHPIISNLRNFSVYSVIWLVIILILTFVDVNIFKADFLTAFTSSCVYNLSYEILGIGLWYNIRYKNFEKINQVNRFLYHLTEASIISIIWVLICQFIISTLFSSEKHLFNLSNGYLPFTFLAGVVYYIFLTLFYYLYISYINLQEKIKNEATLQALVKETELNLLKSQINPHFLFNSLNSISSLTITNPGKAREMIIKLSEFLRKSIGNKEQKMISLSEELQHLLLYLEIEKVRFGERLQYQFDIPETCNKFPIPIMIMQPIIENAIKHGVYEATEPILIKFTCTSIFNGIKICIENNYDPEAPPRKGNRMGLKNVDTRLKLTYHSENLLKTSNENNIFKVEMTFPATSLKQSI